MLWVPIVPSIAYSGQGLAVGLLLLRISWLGLALRIAESILGAAVPHQVTQFAHAHGADFMHADQHGCADRQATVPDLADHWRRHLQRTGQCRIVFEIQPFNQNIEQVIRIVGFLGNKVFGRHG